MRAGAAEPHPLAWRDGALRLRVRLKMLGSTRRDVIQAGDVDPNDARPDGCNREENEALPDGPDGCGMGARRTFVAATGKARAQARRRSASATTLQNLTHTRDAHSRITAAASDATGEN
jgi:hypothetical protein